MNKPDKSATPTALSITLSVLIAQTVIACVSALLVVIGLVTVILLATGGDKTWYDYIVDAAAEPAAHLLQALLLGLASFGVFGLLGIFGTPSLIRYFLRVFAEAKAQRRWVFAANFCGWFGAGVVSAIFWLVPGGQLVAFPIVIATATAITVAILYHHVTVFNRVEPRRPLTPSSVETIDAVDPLIEEAGRVDKPLN